MFAPIGRDQHAKQCSKTTTCLCDDGVQQRSLTQHVRGGHDLTGVHGGHESLRLSLEGVPAGLLHSSDQLTGDWPVAVGGGGDLWPASGVALPRCCALRPCRRLAASFHVTFRRSLVARGVLFYGVLALRRGSGLDVPPLHREANSHQGLLAHGPRQSRQLEAADDAVVKISQRRSFAGFVSAAQTLPHRRPLVSLHAVQQDVRTVPGDTDIDSEEVSVVLHLFVCVYEALRSSALPYSHECI